MMTLSNEQVSHEVRWLVIILVLDLWLSGYVSRGIPRSGAFTAGYLLLGLMGIEIQRNRSKSQVYQIGPMVFDVTMKVS